MGILGHHRTPLVALSNFLDRDRGAVLVQMFIDESGTAKDASVLKGFPDTGMDEAAVDALTKTSWNPAMQSDQPVGVWATIPVNFKLNKEKTGN